MLKPTLSHISKMLWRVLVLALLTSPSHAWQAHQQIMGQSANNNQEKSSQVFIKFGDDLRMNFRRGDNFKDVQGILEPGSIIQIPSQVAQYDQKGDLDLTQTLRSWQNIARHQKQNQGFSHLKAQNWSCEQMGQTPGVQGRCQGVRDGELFFPVKVIRQGQSRTDLSEEEQYGYLALDFLDTEVDSSRYRAGAMSLENALQSTAPVSSGTTTTSGGGNSQGRGETTTQEPVPLPPDPDLRPEPGASSGGGSTNVFNCNNTTYLTSRQNFMQHSCLRNMDDRQRAELIMRDVLRINQKRPAFNLDPRFSVCIAFRESHMHPNALGGTPDYGMYQVINTTGRNVLRMHPPVTPGFSQYRNNWVGFRDNMIRSTLAQADLHHAVIYQKARENRLVSQINQPTSSVEVYQRLATRYNGSNAAAQHYGRRVASCYRAMLQVANRNGQVTNPSRLRAALNQALN